MNWNGKALYTCVMAFDKHNVIDTLNEEEASRFAVLRNKVQYYNNLGGALAVISRGPSKWKKYERAEPGNYHVVLPGCGFLYLHDNHWR